MIVEIIYHHLDSIIQNVLLKSSKVQIFCFLLGYWGKMKFSGGDLSVLLLLKPLQLVILIDIKIG